MSFEATKSLFGARQLVKSVKMQLDTISGYSLPSFSILKMGGSSGGDRISRMVIQKETVEKKLMKALDACLNLEEASQAELDTVDNLELRAIITFRYVFGMTWSQIARKIGGNTTSDAVKKRFERGLKAYEEKQISVPYSTNALKAVRWLEQAMKKAQVNNPSELKKTSVDVFLEKELRMGKAV